MNGNFILLGVLFVIIGAFQFAMRKRWASGQSEETTRRIFGGTRDENILRTEMLTTAFAMVFAILGLVMITIGLFSSPSSKF